MLSLQRRPLICNSLVLAKVSAGFVPERAELPSPERWMESKSAPQEEGLAQITVPFADGLPEEKQGAKQLQFGRRADLGAEDPGEERG